MSLLEKNLTIEYLSRTWLSLKSFCATNLTWYQSNLEKIPKISPMHHQDIVNSYVIYEDYEKLKYLVGPFMKRGLLELSKVDLLSPQKPVSSRNKSCLL